MNSHVVERAGLSAVPEKVPIVRLVAAESLRVHGANAEHVKALAAMETPLPPIVVHWPTMKVIDGRQRPHCPIEVATAIDRTC